MSAGDSIVAERPEAPVHDDLTIARALEEDIIFGRLAPGTRLTEDALLSRFAVTRHFARQALVQLEAMGIVVRERNKGATVRSLTPREVQEIYEVRELRAAAGGALDSAARAAGADRRADGDPRGARPLRRGGLSPRRARGQRPLPPDAVRRLRQPAAGQDHRALHAPQPAGPRQLDGRRRVAARSRTSITG